MKLSIFTIAAAAGLVSSQCISSIPECAQPCLSSAATSAGCVAGDLSCQCSPDKQAAIQQAATSCVLDGCGMDVALRQYTPLPDLFMTSRHFVNLKHQIRHVFSFQHFGREYHGVHGPGANVDVNFDRGHWCHDHDEFNYRKLELIPKHHLVYHRQRNGYGDQVVDLLQVLIHKWLELDKRNCYGRHLHEL
ncbi:hypothetical protein VSDG_10110 [Cytospora chrysosperma]|uniref:CFEM domain-containing protein n=1 Tax=Cytospora chrysosperma TaxID=252740 RepID=A0A423V7Y0_CYTCH|nr:hypothetical protein VSDG_10110 [Valsa sordida]